MLHFTSDRTQSLDPETARAMHDEELPDEAFKDASSARCASRKRNANTQREYEDSTRSFTPRGD